jgi:hypothetical protein
LSEVAEPLLTIIDGDDFEPDLPSAEAIELDGTVEHIISLLNQAGRGEHTAWALSNAMASIMSRSGRRKGPRPSLTQRDRLLQAIGLAYLKANDILPPLCRRSRILGGLEALAGLVLWWAEGDEQRASWHPHAYVNLCAYARIFRNDLHNVSLAEEIEERAEKRCAAIIADLLKQTQH